MRTIYSRHFSPWSCLAVIFLAVANGCSAGPGGGEDEVTGRLQGVEAEEAKADQLDDAENRKLKIVNNSEYDVTVSYKDKDGNVQEVRIRAGNSGEVSDFGGGSISFSPSNAVEGTRVDETGKTTITFKNKPTLEDKQYEEMAIEAFDD